MRYDLIIKNGKIVKTGRVFEGDILIVQGRVSGITNSIQNVDAEQIIDAKDLFILPGVIDPHVHLGSCNSAKVFGVWPEKGTIEVGSDADLVLVDLERSVEVKPNYLHSHSDYSPYEGYRIKGWPVLTISGGRILYKDGQVFHTGKKGKYLSRKGSREIRFRNGESPRS
jgi:dihydroorotase-like cyclic amidohydrolase